MARVRIRPVAAAFLVSASAFAQPQVPAPPPPPTAGGAVGIPMVPGAPSRDSSTKTGTARIRGHVFASDNGAPIRKAQVRLVSQELRENRLATTDADGLYELRDLPAGRYT